MTEVFKPELAIFDLPPVQSSIEKGGYVDIYPSNKELNSGVIDFEIAGTDDYIDLYETKVYLAASVRAADGKTALDANNDAAFVNVPLYSMFQDVTVYLNEEKVSGGDQTYAYQNIISTLLSYSASTLEQQYISAGFVKDVAGHMDSVDAANTAHTARKAWNNGRLYIGKLMPDMFQQARYLVNNVDVKIRFQRAPPEFALRCSTATAKPRFIIDAMRLSVHKVRLAPGAIMAHERTLSVGENALYPYPQRLIETYGIVKGESAFVKENLYRGIMPKLMIVTLLASDAYSGSYAKNPYNFQHYNACLVSLKKDGESIPFQAFEPCYEKDKQNYMREYMNIFSALKLTGRNDMIAFSHAEYPSGYCFYVLNLTPDQSHTSSSFQNEEISNIRLELKFAKALEEGVTVMTLAMFDALLQIDQFRRPLVSEV